ncbi:MAG: trypsin-like peptidase domain-containing protein [Bacteroidetes bacterium]|mgnify:FL=1|jgi:hypothetical protein|nr:trypsin-like peptidase domain-containing protein [Bacteroidota bacterium]MBT3751113.1 trypsin-like peptidase domain-containing protein [Bacteroidota bacterium]MBT4400471.1 trypsin-like peptidase domain-containing protein [Bacteroidota bacterium]MBT4409671.1 trypsin-like peptidase domain-containing protein [Bacteroidota bacterium]MBT5426408.1 trypsin-like peptidase domain-containing protein [Bacteroidota bacterium]
MIIQIKNKSIFLSGLFAVLLVMSACKSKKEHIEDGAWMNQSSSEWPAVVMTNQIQFEDKTFTDFANGFLLDTGTDTVAISCKHVFMAFASMGLVTVDFQGKLIEWKMNPKNAKGHEIKLGELINRDPGEMAALPNASNNSDWLAFHIESYDPGITPLKIGDASVRTGDIVYTVGWTTEDKKGPPRLILSRVFRMVGFQIFLEPITKIDNPAGLSGSPVLNKDGHLVGISSGSEGFMERACSVYYIMDVLKKKNLISP